MNPACPRFEFRTAADRGWLLCGDRRADVCFFRVLSVKLAIGITMNKALDGINVVEFESHLGAAYAAMLLAEQGARAIKVEPRGGSPLRGTPHFHVLNRSKRVLELDLDA